MIDDRDPDDGEAGGGDVIDIILAAIADVAPELGPELGELDRDVDFWMELQLDSMDHLAVMARLAERTGVDIAERDYPRVTTINTLRDFINAGGS